MAQYSNKSIEELRFEDYSKGNKGGNAPAQQGNFMQPNALGNSTLGNSTLGQSTAGNPFSNIGAAQNPLQSSAFPAFTPSNQGNQQTPAPAFQPSTNFTSSFTFPSANPAPSLSDPTKPTFSSSLTAPSLTTPAFNFNKPSGSTPAPAFPSLSAPSTGFQLTTPSQPFTLNQPQQTATDTKSTFNMPQFNTNSFQPAPSIGFQSFNQQPNTMNNTFTMGPTMNQMNQMSQMNMPPPAPPQPIYSTDTVRQKIDFLVKRRVEMVSEAKSSSNEVEIFPKSSIVSSLHGEKENRNSRRIIPRGMRTKLVESTFSTSVDFSHLARNERTSMVSSFSDTKKFKIAAFPDQLLEMSVPILSDTPVRKLLNHPANDNDEEENRLFSNFDGPSALDSPYSKAPEVDATMENSSILDRVSQQLENSIYEDLLTFSLNGYQTIPDLKNFSDSELENVEDFTVIKPNIGKILWPGVTNLRDVQLSRIINIKPKEVFVYEDVPAPPVGTELNKNAVVSLYGIYPKEATEEGYKSLLHRLNTFCQKNDADFISYDKKGGEWTFQVFHFSRYGFDDDDEAENNNNNSQPMETTAVNPGQSFASPNHTENIEKLKMIFTTKKSSPTKTFVEEKITVPSIRYLPSTIDELIPPVPKPTYSKGSLPANVPSFRSKTLKDRLSRSFRVGWALDGKLCQISGFQLQITSPFAPPTESTKSDVKLLGDFLEFFVKLKSGSFSDDRIFMELVRFLTERFSSTNGETNKLLQLAVTLLNSTFGQPLSHSSSKNPIPVLSIPGDYPPESLQRRYTIFKDWLKEAVSMFQNEFTSPNRLNLDLTFVNSNLATAAKKFQMQGAFRSALVATQIGRDAFHKALNEQQLYSWDTISTANRSSAFQISLPGMWFETTFLPNLQDFHWMEIIACVYWYYYHSEGSLQSSLVYFQQLVEQNSSIRSNNENFYENSLFNLLHFLFPTNSSQVHQYGLTALKPEGFHNHTLNFIDSFLLILVLETLHVIPPNSFPSLLLRQQLMFQLLSLASHQSFSSSSIWKTIFYLILSFDSTSSPTARYPAASQGQKLILQDLIGYCPINEILSLIHHPFFLSPPNHSQRNFQLGISELLFYAGFQLNAHNFVDNLHFFEEFKMIIPLHSQHWPTDQDAFIETLIISLLHYFYVHFSQGKVSRDAHGQNQDLNYFELQKIMKTFQLLIDNHYSATTDNVWIYCYRMISSFVEIQISSLELLSNQNNNDHQHHQLDQLQQIQQLSEKCVKLENLILFYWTKNYSFLHDEKKFHFLFQNIQTHLFQIMLTLQREKLSLELFPLIYAASQNYQISSSSKDPVNNPLNIQESLLVHTLDYAHMTCLYNADKL